MVRAEGEDARRSALAREAQLQVELAAVRSDLERARATASAEEHAAHHARSILQREVAAFQTQSVEFQARVNALEDEVEQLKETNLASRGAKRAAELQASEWAAQCARLTAVEESDAKKQEALVSVEKIAALRFALEKEQSRTAELEATLERCSSERNAQLHRLSDVEDRASKLAMQLVDSRAKEAAALERHYSLEDALEKATSAHHAVVAEKDRAFAAQSTDLEARLEESNTALKQAKHEEEKLAKRLESSGMKRLHAEVDEARRMLAEQRRELALKEEELASAARRSKELVGMEHPKVVLLEQELAAARRCSELDLAEAQRQLDDQKHEHKRDINQLSLELQRIRDTPLAARSNARAGTGVAMQCSKPGHSVSEADLSDGSLFKADTAAHAPAGTWVASNIVRESAPIVDLGAMQGIARRSILLATHLRPALPVEGAIGMLLNGVGSSARCMIASGASSTTVSEFLRLAGCLLDLAEELGRASAAGSGEPVVGSTNGPLYSAPGSNGFTARDDPSVKPSIKHWEVEVPVPGRSVHAIARMLASGISSIATALRDSWPELDSDTVAEFQASKLDRTLLVARHELEQWGTRFAWCKALQEESTARQLYTAGSVGLQIISAETASLALLVRRAEALAADKQTACCNESLCLSELGRLDFELAQLEENESSGSLDSLKLTRKLESEQRSRQRESLRDMTSRVIHRTLVMLLFFKQQTEDLTGRIARMRDSMDTPNVQPRGNQTTLERVQRLYLEGSVERMQHELAKASARAGALEHELHVQERSPRGSPELHSLDVIDGPDYHADDVRSLQKQIAGQQLRISQQAAQIDVRTRALIGVRVPVPLLQRLCLVPQAMLRERMRAAFRDDGVESLLA